MCRTLLLGKGGGGVRGGLYITIPSNSYEKTTFTGRASNPIENETYDTIDLTNNSIWSIYGRGDGVLSVQRDCRGFNREVLTSWGTGSDLGAVG